MRKLIALGVAALAVLAFSVVGVATAAAAQPKFLPGSGTLSIKSGAGFLETVGGSTVKCSSDTGSSTISTETTGTFDVLFEGCKSEGFISASCKGLSDTKEGSILVLGSFRTGRQTAGGTPLIIFTLNEVHFSCSIILIATTGTLACTVSPTNTKVKTTGHYTITCEQSKGKAKINSVENAGETGTEAVGLKTSVAGGKAEESGESTVEEATPSVESEIMA